MSDIHFKDDAIVVTSAPAFYVKEESGEKPYTVRLVTREELGQLNDVRPRHIQIHNKALDPRVFFERTITSFDRLGDLLGFVLVGIAWDPAEGQP